MRRRTYIIVVFILLLFLLAFFLDRYCPPSGFGLTATRRVEHRLKNRTSYPQATDFNAQVTLPALLQPGDDENRWKETQAARIEGYVVSVGRAGIELTNCWSPCRRDIHINLALRSGAPVSEQVVVEVTPGFERLGKTHGLDWSAATLERTLVGHWCQFEGWLFYDRHHAKEATNTRKEGEDVWRATAWEIHPVTKIEVLR